mgnify:CR=1 FL=1
MTEFKQDDEITPVIFRKYGPGRGGEVIALFPAEAYDLQGYLCSSYVHVGQHGSADPHHVVRYTRPAKPDEYAALKAELEAVPYGYRLKVYSREQPAHRAARMQQARDWRARA